MYINNKKTYFSLFWWTLVGSVAFMGAAIFTGIFFDDSPMDDPVPTKIMFFLMAAGSIALLVCYIRNMTMLGTVTRLNRLFAADEDGYVPVEDLCKETGIPEHKLLAQTNKAMLKGYIINCNYNAAEKAFLLSDKIRKVPALTLRGAPENKPFIGIHCPGCAASLKIRVETKGTCPYCGREIIAPALTGTGKIKE